jgi:hypothetical protein
MEIVIGRMDGKMPVAWEITVKGDSATYEYYFRANRKFERIKLSSEELNRMAHAVQKAKPDQINAGPRHGVMYDRATSYIKLKHKNYTISIAEGAKAQIKGKRIDDFTNIFDTVHDIVIVKLAK